jgi:hypothetical protein
MSVMQASKAFFFFLSLSLSLNLHGQFDFRPVLYRGMHQLAPTCLVIDRIFSFKILLGNIVAHSIRRNLYCLARELAYMAIE